jgi:cytoskeleton protein RodZ
MNVGNELRQAREHAGLTAQQISERTKIQLYKIEALENNQFDRLPQGIYLDGIVRAYAHEVGIDPEPMVDRVRLQRGKLPGDWEVPFAAPIDLHGTSTAPEPNVLEALDGDDPLDGFIAESEADLADSHADLPLSIPIPPAPVTRSAQPESRDRYVPAARPLVYKAQPVTAPAAPATPVAPVAAAPIAATAPAAQVAPVLPVVAAPVAPIAPGPPVKSRARIALLVFAVVAGAGSGAYLYESNRLQNLAAAARTAPEARPAQPLPVPYSENAIISEPSPRGTTGSDASAVSGDTRPDSPISSTPERRGGPTAQDAPEPARAPRNAALERPARTAAPSKPQSADANSAVADVTGSWTIDTHVETSSYKGYAGLKLGYELKLEQDGDRVTGVGRKVTENGAGIGPRAQTPLTVSGTIEGDRLTLTFVERGARRPTQGKFVLLVDDGETLRGRFTSTAAQSSGRVEAHRVSAQ